VTPPPPGLPQSPSQFEVEVAAAHRFERHLVAKELAAILVVVVLVLARQLWLS
jgi:hypothetical protein